MLIYTYFAIPSFLVLFTQRKVVAHPHESLELPSSWKRKKKPPTLFLSFSNRLERIPSGYYGEQANFGGLQCAMAYAAGNKDTILGRICQDVDQSTKRYHGIHFWQEVDLVTVDSGLPTQ
jgi:hypothetical protein